MLDLPVFLLLLGGQHLLQPRIWLKINQDLEGDKSRFLKNEIKYQIFNNLRNLKEKNSQNVFSLSYNADNRVSKNKFGSHELQL